MVRDNEYMALALKLARKGMDTTHPNPAVGCVIVLDDEVVGEGYHEIAGYEHAEVHALKQAGKRARSATMYVTLEPCSHQGKTPPCAEVVIKSGISRVVIASQDPNPLVSGSGISMLRDAGIHVDLGIGAAEATSINRGFFKRMTTQMPWIVMKTAISLDGRTAMANGESQWITDEPARLDAQKMRARSSAVITGVGTVLRDNPSMNVRLEGTKRQPLRVILDTNLSTPVDSKILQEPGSVLIATSKDEADNELFQRDNVEIFVCPLRSGVLDLTAVMKELGRRGVNVAMLESGARLGGNMLQQGLVDELVVYMAPDLLGSDAKDMFKLSGLEHMKDKIKLAFNDIRKVGRDLKITLSVEL